MIQNGVASNKIRQRKRAPALLRVLPWMVLTVMLCITWLAWEHERESAQRALHSQFDFDLRETVSRIDQRILGYEQMLHGVQSLFSTTAMHNRAAMHAYIEALQLDANFSAAQVIGLVDWVPGHRKGAHIQSMRSAGFTSYVIEPNELHDDYAPIIQREPFVGRNVLALGMDAWVDPVRRIAMERARDSGLASISGKVRLRVDGTGNSPPGFIMYLPIYAPGLPHDTVQQRRAHLLGWVYAAFHMRDLMASLFGDATMGLSVAMYDGTEANEAALMYQSDASAAPIAATPATLQATEYMVESGHDWTLSLQSQDSYAQRYGRSIATALALAGITLSALLALLAWLLVNGRERALRIASTMTEELRHMAQHDPLTGIPNRALFNDRLLQELARAKRQRTQFALVFIDLDHFKPINDNFGHAVGDHILKDVAVRLQGSVRDTDTVGRIGGDEFVVLLAQLGEHDPIEDLAEKLRVSLKPPFQIGGKDLPLSCSVGVAVYPKDGTTPIALMKSADEAMYRAKAEGRNCVRLSA